MKNAYAVKQNLAVDKAYKDGMWDGITIAMKVVAIALNRSHGFGKKRIEEVEVEVNSLLNDMIKLHPDQVAKHLEIALSQIRGGFLKWAESMMRITRLVIIARRRSFLPAMTLALITRVIES